MGHALSSRHSHPVRGGVLLWALVCTLVFGVVEAVGGWWAGSLALLGDAGHMFSDGASLGMAALAAWVAKKPASRRHSYGLGRAEIIAAMINGLLMVAIVVGIVIAAVGRLSEPQPVSGATVIVVAGLGLLVNIVIATILHRGEQTLNVRAALLHVMADLFSSVAALLAGVVILASGWTLIDPILSIVICVMILYSAVYLLREGLHVLMEGVPLDLDLAQVGRSMAEVEHVASIHDLHIWTLRSGSVALSAHVVIDDMGRWGDILRGLQQLLESRFGITHVTLQPESRVHVLQPIEPAAL